jgi:hypothetical protein
MVDLFRVSEIWKMGSRRRGSGSGPLLSGVFKMWSRQVRSITPHRRIDVKLRKQDHGVVI